MKCLVTKRIAEQGSQIMHVISQAVDHGEVLGEIGGACEVTWITPGNVHLYLLLDGINRSMHVFKASGAVK